MLIEFKVYLLILINVLDVMSSTKMINSDSLPSETCQHGYNSSGIQ